MCWRVLYVHKTTIHSYLPIPFEAKGCFKLLSSLCIASSRRHLRSGTKSNENIHHITTQSTHGLIEFRIVNLFKLKTGLVCKNSSPCTLPNIQLSKSGIADAVASNLYPTIPVPGKWFSCGKEVRFPFYKWLSTIRAGGKIFIRGQSCSLSSDRPQIIPRLYAHTNSRCTPMQVPFFRNFSPLNCSYKARYFWS